MLHLLTEEHKKKVKREYMYRILTVMLVLVTFVSLIGILLVIPSYVKIHSRYGDLTSERDVFVEKIKLRQNDNSSDGIKNVQNSIASLKKYSQKYSLRDLIIDLTSKKQSGVSISRFTYSKNNETPTIDLAGKADSRANLQTFSDVLKNNKSFSGVSLPLSSFTREKDIDFSLKLSVISSPIINEKQ